MNETTECDLCSNKAGTIRHMMRLCKACAAVSDDLDKSAKTVSDAATKDEHTGKCYKLSGTKYVLKCVHTDPRLLLDSHDAALVQALEKYMTTHFVDDTFMIVKNDVTHRCELYTGGDEDDFDRKFVRSLTFVDGWKAAKNLLNER